MARKSSTEKAAEKYFIQRPDGDWEYFPAGLSKPGYRVDSALRRKLLASSSARAKQISLIAGAGLVGLVHFAAVEVASAFPVTAPFALSVTIQGSMIVLLVILLAMIQLRLDSSSRERLLVGSPAVAPRLSGEEARAKAAADFSKLPIAGRVIFYLFFFGGSAWMLYEAFTRFSNPTVVSIAEVLILLFGGALFALFPIAPFLKRLLGPRRTN